MLLLFLISKPTDNETILNLKKKTFIAHSQIKSEQFISVNV